VLLALDRPEAGGCDVSAYQQHPGDHGRGIRFDCAGNRDVLGGGAAKVTVITVTESLPPIYYGLTRLTPSNEDLDSFDAVCKEFASKVLDEARAMAEQSGISAELLHVSNEHPATAIIETAKARGCDLIVMASHGRDVLRKLLLGSQTSEVLASGTVPVLVVPRT
jgi:nucleotide-binding universal stress UspA family protein